MDFRVQAQVHSVRGAKVPGGEDGGADDISGVQADNIGDAAAVDDRMICI